MLSRSLVKRVMESYGAACIDRDIVVIPQIFTSDAEFSDNASGLTYKGHQAIMDYWKTKTAPDQSSVRFNLIDFFIDKERETVIAIYEKSIVEESPKKDCVDEPLRKDYLKRVDVARLEKGKISNLREYQIKAEE